ncbi:hypothetical protein MMC07_006168 [Pseudocyphellaria aurata]|nr:hypothetical protein [Pseudocyphellaria aurata]
MTPENLFDRDSPSDLSPGMRGFMNFIDRAKSWDELQQLPKSWLQNGETSIEELWEQFPCHLKNGTANGRAAINATTTTREDIEKGETEISNSGVISEWLKKPAKRFWRKIWGIFRRLLSSPLLSILWDMLGIFGHAPDDSSSICMLFFWLDLVGWSVWLGGSALSE